MWSRSHHPLPKAFRQNVGGIVFNDKGQVLAAHRHNRGRPIDETKGWQFPQGGIEPEDSSKLEAALREVGEELGIPTADLTPVAEVPGEYSYIFPDTVSWSKVYAGQDQTWYLFHWNGEISQLRLDQHIDEGAKWPEFREARWLDSFSWLTFQMVWFKKPIYQRLSEVVPPMIAQYLATRRSML